MWLGVWFRRYFVGQGLLTAQPRNKESKAGLGRIPMFTPKKTNFPFLRIYNFFTIHKKEWDIYFGNVGAWTYLQWQMNVREALSSAKRESNPQPDNRWDVLTIELPRLRWWAKVEVRHVCGLSGRHYMLLIMLLMRYIFWKCGAWRYLEW